MVRTLFLPEGRNRYCVPRFPEGGLTKDSVVLTGQIRAVAKIRLLLRLGELQPDTMRQIEQALKITLQLP